MTRIHIAQSNYRFKVDHDIVDLAEAFVDNRRRQLADAFASLEANDHDALERLGHELKGTGGSYGFHALARLGEQLEIAAFTRGSRDCQRLLEQIQDLLDNVVIVTTS